MSQEPDMSFADGVRVKEELEIGPTVLQPRSVCDPIIKVEEDFDTSSCSIKTENDVDYESEPPNSKLLTAGCAPESLSVEESLKYETGSQEEGDMKPVISESFLKWEMRDGESCSEVQPRVLATESRAGDSLTRAAQLGAEWRFAAAARRDTHCVTTTPSGKKLKKCKICNAKFTHTSNLQRHKLIHTTERPYECKICNSKFTHRSNLQRHKLLHTAERPYECEICNVKCKRSDGLKSHKLTHIGEKPFECEICNAKFKRVDQFKSHKQIHTGEKPFECEICNAKFTRAGNLKSHKLTHTGEKPFECEICNAKFAVSSNLKSHKRTHTGEKPFKCEICNAKFKWAGHFKSHKRIHTGEKSCEGVFQNILKRVKITLKTF